MVERRKVITIEVDQEKGKELYFQKIEEHLQELESEVVKTGMGNLGFLQFKESRKQTAKSKKIS